MQRFPGLKQWKVEMTARAMQGSRTIKTAKGEIQYTDIGDGLPVLHSHGSPAGCDVGPLLLKDLTDYGFRIITPSRPGFLKTSLEVGRTPEQQADAFAALLDVLEINKIAVHAWSGGGPPALQFALRYPERVSCLIMLAAVAHRWDHQITFFEKLVMTDIGLWLIYLLSGLLKTGFRKQSAQELGVNYDYVSRHPEKLELLDDFFTITAPASLRWSGSQNDIKQYSKLPTYPFERIFCPTLVLFSPSDNQLPVSNGDIVAEKVPNGEYFKFEKGGHMPQLDEQAEEILERIINFLKKHTCKPNNANEPDA